MKCFNYYIATYHYTQILVLCNIIPDLYFSNKFTYLTMNMGYLQYQSTLLFTIIVLFMIIVLFDDFINLNFILRISNTNFVYYYSSKEGQGTYCYSLILNIQNEHIGIKALTKNSVLYIYAYFGTNIAQYFLIFCLTTAQHDHANLLKADTL